MTTASDNSASDTRAESMAPIDESATTASSTTASASGDGARSKKGGKAVVKSAAPAGLPLKGLNYIKGAADPLAMEDNEYPDWLWTILDGKAKSGPTESNSKAPTRKRHKSRARLESGGVFLAKRTIPLHEQTTNLPGGDGTLQGALRAGEARDDLTKAMREKRRAKIKESNFLKAMG